MPALTPIQEELLDTIYDRFRSTSAWPTTTQLEIDFRARGSAKRLATEIGRELVVWEWSGPESQCYLTVRGLATRAGAQPDVARFLTAVRYLASRYVQSVGEVQVSAAELVQELGFSEDEARRVAALIRREPELLASYTIPPSPQWPTFAPSRLAIRLEHVASLGEYWQAIDRFIDDERSAAVHSQAAVHEQEAPIQSLARPPLSERVTSFLEAERAKRGLLWAVLAGLASLIFAALALL